MNEDSEDEFYMQLALVEALTAFSLGEVPVGAVLVYEGVVIAAAHNLVETKKDPTAHAELLCLRAGAAALNRWRLTGATLYSTLEPCTLCAGGMFLARLSRLVWGARDLRHGANGSWIDLWKLHHPMHTINVSSGVLEKPCASILKFFFMARRKKLINGR